MAQRRMLSLKIIDTDIFLDMPVSAQNLYFHLNMRADDDGFIANPKKILRMIGCGDDDMKILLAKDFIIPFDSGICVIKHWKIHNYIQADRYNETIYRNEKEQLKEDGNKMYTKCIQNVSNADTQVRVRLEKELELDTDKSKKSEEETICYAEIIEELNLICNTTYKPTTAKTKELIKARYKEGFTLEDFKTVIRKKYNSWKNSDMAKYLRPVTLFGTKFESYLNEIEVQTEKEPEVSVYKPEPIKDDRTSQFVERYYEQRKNVDRADFT